MCRVVGYETQPVPVLAKLPHGLRRTSDRNPGDLKNPVDVQQNGGHGRRVYSGDQDGGAPRFGDRAALLALARPRRPARSEERDAGGSDLRSGGFLGAHAGPEGARGSESRPRPPIHRPGRGPPVAESRGCDRAARGGAQGRTEGRAPTPTDPPDGSVARAAPRAEAPPQHDETAAPAPRITPRATRRWRPW